jgi:hypothetical protein
VRFPLAEIARPGLFTPPKRRASTRATCLQAASYLEVPRPRAKRDSPSLITVGFVHRHAPRDAARRQRTALSARASRCPPPTMDALSAASARPCDLASTTSRSPWAGRTVTALTATSVLLVALIPLRVRSRVVGLPRRHGRSSLPGPLQRHLPSAGQLTSQQHQLPEVTFLASEPQAHPSPQTQPKTRPEGRILPTPGPKSASRGDRGASPVTASRAGTHGSALPSQISPLRTTPPKERSAPADTP